MWHMHPTEKWLENVIIKMNEKQLNPDESKFKLVDNTIWLSQKQMAELFDKDSDTIGLKLIKKHLNLDL